MTEPNENQSAPIRELSAGQRRVLGVLVEKGFTTPEYYPLTLKAVTAGCNQKSNRSPLSNYSEDEVQDVLEELRELGLVAIVHTESGRTERYRHYMRHRFTFTEPQLAVLTELLLRGRQSLGELRARASRMVGIDSLADLRAEALGLLEQDFVQTSGPLERRGVEIDHNLYRGKENKSFEPSPGASPTAAAPPATASAPSAGPPDDSRLVQCEARLAELTVDNQELHKALDDLKNQVCRLTDEITQLKQELGG